MNEYLENIKKEYLRLANIVPGQGGANLVEYLNTKTAFFEMPATVRYYENQEGGLARHSIRVVNMLLKLNKDFGLNYNEASLIKLGLCCKLGKCDSFESYFKKEFVNGEWVDVKKYKYNQNKSLAFGDLGANSYILGSCFFTFEPDEATALLNYNHVVNMDRYTEVSQVIESHNLTLLLHIADMMAIYFKGVMFADEQYY